MAEQAIHLSAYQVQQLQREGSCEWRRDCALGASCLYELGVRLRVKESVAKPKSSDTSYRYSADGREPGYFYLPNYQMPGAASRLWVEAVASWRELVPIVDSDEDQTVQCFTLQLLPNVLSA